MEDNGGRLRKIQYLEKENTALRRRVTKQRRELKRLNRFQKTLSFGEKLGRSYAFPIWMIVVMLQVITILFQ